LGRSRSREAPHEPGEGAMSKRLSPESVATVRVLLLEYYSSGRRHHTYESIARRAGVSRSTVARAALEVRKVWPTVSELLEQMKALERRITVLEERLEPAREKAA